MPTETQKTVAGALLIGASALTGNALLLTAASGVGVNWTSEGLIELWQRAGQPPTPRAALIRAGEQSIQQAVETLRRAYQQESGGRADESAFALVRECASAVAQAQYPTESLTPIAAQQALAASLDELLYGHEARQFLEDRLLDAVAIAFREALAADEQAWRLFHGWLLEQIMRQTTTLQQHFARVPDVLAQLQDQGRAAVVLSASAESLRQLRDELHDAIEQLKQAPPAGTTFENTDMEVGGDFDQAGEDIYKGSSVAGDRAAPPRPPRSRSTSFTNQGVRVKGNVRQAGGSIDWNSAHAEGTGSAATVYNTSGDTINVSNAQGSILNIKSQLDNVTQSISTIPADQATRQALEQLLQQFGAQLQQAAAQGRAEEAEIAARRAATLVEEAKKAQPDKELVTFNAESLKKAAGNIAAALPAILPIADQIVRHIQTLIK